MPSKEIMKVELKVVGRLVDVDGKTVSRMDRKETGPATAASTLGRDLGREVGAALERIAKKGVIDDRLKTVSRIKRHHLD